MSKLRSILLLALATSGIGNAMAADVYLQTQRTVEVMPNGENTTLWVFQQCDDIDYSMNCSILDAPGPRIDAAAGVSLTFHVKNNLPVPVSLIVPGQMTNYDGAKVTVPDTKARNRARSMTVEVASGDTGSYTIASPKAGTYLYQSGTAPSLQVPMGLYGALVVTDGSEPATDALVVLSEFDHLQNFRVDEAATAAMPMTEECVGMDAYAASVKAGTPIVGYPCSIDYNPRHLLVNGGDGLDLSVADTGGTVLMRWANAGLKTHTPSIVGLDQDLIAEDGNPYPGMPRKQSVIMLPAGGTVDALATIAAGNETLSLFDRQPGFRNDSELEEIATDTGPGTTFGGITVGVGSTPVTGTSGVVNDEYDVTEDTLYDAALSVLANDTPSTPEDLGVAAQPSNGSLTLNANGTFSYTPAAEFSGVDQFVYTNNGELGHVTLNVSYENDVPEANADEYGTNRSGSELAVVAPGVLANDKDADGDTLYAKLDGTPAGVALSADGSFTYAGGGTTFSYFACDDAALTSCSAAATVTVPATGTPSNIALTVQDENGTAITDYRWTVEEDTTWRADPSAPSYDVLALNFHKSYMPTVAQGVGATEFEALALDDNKHYYVSVLPADGNDENGHALGGASFKGDATSVSVNVHTTPTETAQISIFVFNDNTPTNGAWDTGETGLGGFQITLEDAGGRYGASAGLLSYDAFGEPLTNALDCFGIDDGGQPKHLNGVILACPDTPENQAAGVVGEVLIKNLYPGKYGVIVTPPEDQVADWKQTSTIEGTKLIDAWVRAGEPARFQEFGPPGWHAFVGFVNPDQIAAESPTGTNSVSGAITNAHMSRPPLQTIWDSGSYAALAHTRAWISVNSAGGEGTSYAVVQADEEGNFTIDGLPDGDYQLAVFDQYLDQVLAYRAFSVPGAGDVGNIPVFNWFSRSEHTVFQDDGCVDNGGGGTAGNGIREGCELPLAEQNINLRWRDGTIYQAFATDGEGFVPFDQVFPFFHWQVAEVDFARFKATGVTVTVDAGGNVRSTGGVLAPQEQPDGTFSRTETGPALTEGFQGFLGQTNVFEWGKTPWPAGENGGISGIVYYATTRAENDPRLAAAEPWEPGVAGATVRLYRKVTKPATVPAPVEGDLLKEGDYTLSMPVNGTSGSYRAQIGVMDLDEFVPLAEDYNSKPPGETAKVRMSIGSDSQYIGAPLAIRRITDGDYALGAETIVLNESSLVFVEETTTDDWDATPPEGCPGADPSDAVILGPDAPLDKCYDGLRNFNQVRPGVFDGGYAFGLSNDPAEQLEPGLYVVEVVPPAGTEILKEEDNNVGFGESFAGVTVPVLFPTGGAGTFPDPAIVQDVLLNVGLAQPRCVGEPRTVPASMTLFPDDAPFAGATRPLCDRKEVLLTDQGQAAAEFWVLTQAPIATHFAGMILDDTATEFSIYSPAFGEKWAPPYVPVSIRRGSDGVEIGRVISDQHGRFNGLAPSTYSAYLPSPSGFSPNMLITCMNDPGPIPDPDNPGEMIVDPNFNPAYSNFCYTFQYMPGTTTYLDTPVLPVSAFAAGYNPPDCALPDASPKISSVVGNVMTGPIVGTNPYDPGAGVASNGNVLTITAVGDMDVPNPAYQGPVATPTVPAMIPRHYGFGDTPGTVMIGNSVLNIVSWSDSQIVAMAPGSDTADGHLTVTTASGVSTEAGIYVTVTSVGAESNGVINVPVDQPTIQAAIEAANPGDTVLVAPGAYDENVIMWKPVKLQGSGAGSTIINGITGRVSIDGWNELVDCKFGIGAGCDKVVDALPNQPDGAVGLETEAGATITVLAPFDTRQGPARNRPANRFQGRDARIDGFSITGGLVGGGVVVNGYAHGLQVSNNDIFSNSGGFSGGVRVGRPALELADPQTLLGEDTYEFNDNLVIAHNVVRQNGALAGSGGGISISTGTDNYSISENYICGNFTLGDGAGIGHLGLSDKGKIDNNTIVLNQSFDQAAPRHGGGIFIGGEPSGAGVLTIGAGSVNIEDNLIQGNQAGAGHGGGIRAQFVNGQDVVEAKNPGGLFRIDIINNMIVNNVAGHSGGGVSLADTVAATLLNNTVAHNDSTATVGSLIQIGVGTNTSTPQPAGISTQVHSAELDAAVDAKNGNQWNNYRDYSNPAITNTIVWQNRSFSYLSVGTSTGLTPEVNGPGCAGANFWDLGVLSGGHTLDRVEGSILTTTPGADPDFVNSYCNGSRQDGTGPIAAFPAVDEGGATWIDVRFGPLVPQGDYHVAGASTAIDGANDSAPASDIDGDARPQGAFDDIGADEYVAPVL